MRYAIAFMLLCGVVEAQSIVTSGSRQSIIVSGRSESPQTILLSKPSETEPQKPPETVKPPVVVQKPVTLQTKRREWYLVSEPWCVYCPRAKEVFLAKGWSEDNVISRAECQRRFGFTPSTVPYEFGEPLQSTAVATQPVRQYVQPVRQSSMVQWQGRTYDANNYGGCSNPNCAMCKAIRSRKTNSFGYQTMSLPVVPPEEDLPEGQKPTPHDVVEQAVEALGPLTPSDVLADYGCGDARILIAAVKRYGCSAVGIEIDPNRANVARAMVERNGLSSRIEIITGDVLQFQPEDYNVTAITVYLFPELLEKLKDKMQSAKVIVSVFHLIPDLPMSQSGDVWVARK